MPEPDELDCQQNILPKCPHCGYDDEDYYDYTNGEHTCGVCGKKFVVEVENVLMFSTRKA